MAPLPGQAVKLFFSTSPRTLSPRFYSALVKRGRVPATDRGLDVGETSGKLSKGISHGPVCTGTLRKYKEVGRYKLL